MPFFAKIALIFDLRAFVKSVLIIAKGKVARIFLNILNEQYAKNNNYIVVTNEREILELDLSSSFILKSFEPTSQFHIQHLIDKNLIRIFIVVESPKERDYIALMIRGLNSDIPITLLCESKKEIDLKVLEKPNLDTISLSFIAARALIQQMPNIPQIARGFGLNKGEIMQINIPYGSAYSYISVGSLSQKEWKIAGIYRQNKLIITNPNTIIQPNDIILAVGEPRILNRIYKRISNYKNSFPLPFGQHIFVYIDFRFEIKSDIFNIINDALYLHKKIKNVKIFINIINPRDFELLNKIKQISNEFIIINIIYAKTSIEREILNNCDKKIGLIIISHNAIKCRRIKKALLRANAPVLKIGSQTRISEVESTLVLSSENPLQSQNIAWTIVDIASQLDVKITLYEFQIDGEYCLGLENYYKNLGRMFNKEILIIQSNAKNPILIIGDEKILQFLPLKIDLLKNKFSLLWNKNIDYLSLNIDKNPQILLPM